MTDPSAIEAVARAIYEANIAAAPHTDSHAAARAAIAALRGMGMLREWIACSERMPRPLERVLVDESGSVRLAQCHHYITGAILFEDECGECCWQVDKWMPLPRLPAIPAAPKGNA